MLLRIYQLMWALTAAAAGIFWLSGNFNMLTAVVFGFVCFGLVFMGMMSVLPTMVAHPEPVRHVILSKEPQAIQQRTSALERIYAFKRELMSSSSVEIRKPKYH